MASTDDNPVDEMTTVAEYLEGRVAHLTRRIPTDPENIGENEYRRDQLRQAASTLREEIALSQLDDSD